MRNDSDSATESEDETAANVKTERRRERRNAASVAATTASVAPPVAVPVAHAPVPATPVESWNNVLTLLSMPRNDRGFISPFASLMQQQQPPVVAPVPPARGALDSLAPAPVCDPLALQESRAPSRQVHTANGPEAAFTSTLSAAVTRSQPSISREREKTAVRSQSEAQEKLATPQIKPKTPDVQPTTTTMTSSATAATANANAFVQRTESTAPERSRPRASQQQLSGSSSAEISQSTVGAARVTKTLVLSASHPDSAPVQISVGPLASAATSARSASDRLSVAEYLKMQRAKRGSSCSSSSDGPATTDRGRAPRQNHSMTRPSCQESTATAAQRNRVPVAPSPVAGEHVPRRPERHPPPAPPREYHASYSSARVLPGSNASSGPSQPPQVPHHRPQEQSSTETNAVPPQRLTAELGINRATRIAFASASSSSKPSTARVSTAAHPILSVPCPTCRYRLPSHAFGAVTSSAGRLDCKCCERMFEPHEIASRGANRRCKYCKPMGVSTTTSQQQQQPQRQEQQQVRRSRFAPLSQSNPVRPLAEHQVTTHPRDTTSGLSTGAAAATYTNEPQLKRVRGDGRDGDELEPKRLRLQHDADPRTQTLPADRRDLHSSRRAEHYNEPHARVPPVSYADLYQSTSTSQQAHQGNARETQPVGASSASSYQSFSRAPAPSYADLYEQSKPTSSTTTGPHAASERASPHPCRRCSRDVLVKHLHLPNGKATVWRCVCCEEYLLKPAFSKQQRLSETPTCTSCVDPETKKKKQKKKKKKKSTDAEDAENMMNPATLQRLQGVVIDAQQELAAYAASFTEIDTNPVVTISMRRRPISKHVDIRKNRIKFSRDALAELERLLRECDGDDESNASVREQIHLERCRLERVEANMLVREAMILAALLKRQGHVLSPALQSVVDQHATPDWESEVLTEPMHKFKLSASTRQSLRQYRQQKQAQNTQSGAHQAEPGEVSALEADDDSDDDGV